MSATTTRFATRRPVMVVVVWIAVVVGGFAVGIGVFNRLESDVGTVPGSESDRAWSLIAASGTDPVELTAIVHGRPVTDPAVRDAVDAAVADVRGLPGVVGVTDPQPSTATGEALLLRIRLRPGVTVASAAQAAAERLRRIDTATVAIEGAGLTTNEFNDQARSDVQHAETLSTPVVLLLLLVVFGGVIAAGLPLLVAVAAVACGFAILYGFSLVTDVSVYAVQVTTMLSVGLAVDYGLLMVSRFREERAVTRDVATAVARTCATAGRTVRYSGLTVAAVLAGLLVFPEPFLRSMGLAGLAVVAAVVLAASTLLPALLTLFGRAIAPSTAAPGEHRDARSERHRRGARSERRRRDVWSERHRRWGGWGGAEIFARIAGATQRRPVVTALGATAVMIVITLPVIDLRLASVDAGMLPTATQTRQVHDAVATHFPELNRPSPVLVAAATGRDDPRLAALRERIRSVPHVTSAEVTRSERTTLLRVTVDAPSHSSAARRAVTAIRAIPAPFDVAVTGDAAALADYRAMLVDRLPWAVAVVAVTTSIVLFLFTGSVLLPLKAVLTNLLSIGAALGGVVWVFQQGNLAGWFGVSGLGAIHITVPVLVGAIAFGLSVDYEVFLLARIREHWLTCGDNRRAVVCGLRDTGRIITCAAALLGVVFAGFLVAGFVPVKAIGLGLVLAVALDATVVRLLLVPATMTLFGRYNWWAPEPLRRLHDRLGLDEASAGGPAASGSRS